MDGIWKLIPGTVYEASARGCVRRIGGVPLKPRRHTNGYHRVSLGFGNDAYVHRLIALTFHGEPPQADCHADHINGDRTDNRAENIRWLTPQENRSLRNFARGERSGVARLTEDGVRQIRGSDLSSAELARLFGVAPRTIRDVRSGKQWSHVNG